jgi:3-oxoacyl-[acyl-carrier protein] reductase
VAASIKAAGGTALLVGGDVTQDGVPARIVAEAVAGLGRLDVLVNNAGGLVKRVPIGEYGDDLIDDVIDLNIPPGRAFHARGRQAHDRAGRWRQHHQRHLDRGAQWRAGGGAVLYAASKGFISTATRGWAKELVGNRIRVNAVSPGVITTPFHERYSTPEQLAAMKATVPMNRLGVAEECTGAFLYLASEAASGYVTGQIIEVNGGQFMP